MQLQTIKTYSFDELSEGAKQKALDQHRNWNVESWNYGGWAEYLLSEKREELEKLGYEDIEFFWSGFSSQGDGASFKANVDIETWLRVNRKTTKYYSIYKNSDNVRIDITKDRDMYQHEMMMSVNCENWGDNEKVNNTIDELGNLILEDARKEAKKLYRELETEYEYLTSDEAIAESWNDNDYQFTVDGTMWNY